MQFTLSPEITDQIIFAMENQTEKMVFDTEKRETLKESSLTPPLDRERYVDIPEWNSFSGFQLMEKFVAGLRNPVYKEALRNALSQGKGVFRKFKDVLKETREIERLWYAYKEKEMKRIVKEWYFVLAELQSFQNLDVDLEFLEETGDIILEDFVFDTVADDIGYETLKEHDKSGFFEALRGYDPRWIDGVYRRRMESLPEMEEPPSKLLIARSPSGEPAGFVWAVRDNPQSVRIVSVYVLEEYRGLGLASALLDEMINTITDAGEAGQIEMEFYGPSCTLLERYENRGFAPYTRSLLLQTKDWTPDGKID